VVQNILDEPILEAVKKRLLKPLLPRPIPPPRKRNVKKQKAMLHEFDPLHTLTKRKLGVNPGELLPLVTAEQALTKLPQFTLLKEAGLVKMTKVSLNTPPSRRRSVQAQPLSFSAAQGAPQP